jgi:hypothetical protein
MCNPPFIFPSITYCRMQFIRKMPSMQLFIRSIVCRIFLSYLTLCNTSSFSHDRSKYSPFIPLQHHISKLQNTFRSVQVSAPHKAMLQISHSTISSLNLSEIYWRKLWNDALGMAILDLISRVHLASLVIMSSKHLKYSKFQICF